jgi:hypothetical protein
VRVVVGTRCDIDEIASTFGSCVTGMVTAVFPSRSSRFCTKSIPSPCFRCSTCMIRWVRGSFVSRCSSFVSSAWCASLCLQLQKKTLGSSAFVELASNTAHLRTRTEAQKAHHRKVLEEQQAEDNIELISKPAGEASLKPGESSASSTTTKGGPSPSTSLSSQRPFNPQKSLSPSAQSKVNVTPVARHTSKSPAAKPRSLAK